MSDGRNPRKPFYMPTVGLYADGTLDLAFEGGCAFDTEEEAAEWLREQRGCEGYVYLCQPVLAFTRGPLTMRRLGAAPKASPQGAKRAARSTGRNPK